MLIFFLKRFQKSAGFSYLLTSPFYKIHIPDKIASIVTTFFREGCAVQNPSHLVSGGGGMVHVGNIVGQQLIEIFGRQRVNNRELF